MGAYETVYRQSLEDPEGFWGEQAKLIDWYRPADQVLDNSEEPFTRWFVGGELNTCHNCLDRHVDAGHGARTALIYDSPVTDTVQSFTYAELLDEVSRLAGALAGLGVGKGDRVVLYLPMVPEAVMGMLACARLGAVHSVVFGGFAANQLAKRIDDAQPKVVLSASCGVEAARVIEYKPLLDKALGLSTHRVDACVILARPQAHATLVEGRDHDWATLVADAAPADCVPVAATDPLYILYTSGTTGRPKGIVRDNGGHAVALRWTMTNHYDLTPDDVFFTASDIGWVVGHSYIVYGPLLLGCTTIVYEGKPVGTPDAGAFWRVCEQHGVKALFCAPTALRAVRGKDPSGDLIRSRDLSRFVTLFQAGERLDPDTYHWATEVLNRPVIDHWWQTETGWAIAGNPRGLEPMPPKPGSATVPMPGYDLQVLDDAGRPVPNGTIGTLATKLPLPPGTLPRLWQDDRRFVDSYMSSFPGYYTTHDGGLIDEDGYVFVMGRTDDVMNVAGHRLSTGSIEEVLANHPDVAEAAAFGVADPMKGQIPLAVVVLAGGVDRDHDELRAELRQSIRDEIGAIATPRDVRIVPRLPKTRSGKILRAPMRSIVDGVDFEAPATIEDPAALEEMREALGGNGSTGGGSEETGSEETGSARL
ncbi:MAG TPA: propionyl-CoA synthetase [Frankiaceae bacterium]|nr:propionyl-CoA synthetase [Frankiaceae bacterium]